MLFFKFPFNEKIYTLNLSGSGQNVDFVSFDGFTKKRFEGSIEETNADELDEKTTAQLSSVILEFPIEDEHVYTKKIESVIGFIKKNNLEKLVIARQKLFVYSKSEEDKPVNLTKTFLNLCRTYPNAFAYIFIDNGVCWLGAFSEILGRFNKNKLEFETMSLAGTLPVNEAWTQKEIEEQKPVTDYISNILEQHSSEVTVSETYDHISGNIKHLRTDFKAKILQEDLEEIISELHPTPAVCGIPKNLCKNAIKNFETMPRDFYAGYIRIETPGFTHYYVNLRCAEFHKNAARIFAGGGITAKSNPTKEWRETELKSEAILKNIAI